MPGALTASDLDTLRALCDTFVPRVSRVPDPHGFWSRTASDLSVHLRTAEYLEGTLDAGELRRLQRLLRVLRTLGFTGMHAHARARVLAVLGAASAHVRAGLDALRSLTLVLFYAATDHRGSNVNWPAIGYAPPARDVALPLELPLVDPHGVGTQLECDVCVIGSGAGGSVVAAELALAGLDVLVLEAGRAYADGRYPADETRGMSEMYWRGGPALSDDGMVTLLAGRTLGGGTTVNWMTCVTPPARVRESWAQVHGLTGLDGDAFDENIAHVLRRLHVSAEPTDSPANARLRAAADALGWSARGIARNVDRSRLDPGRAGAVTFGDSSGAKLDATRTFLHDAAAAGARVLTQCQAERVLVENGRARGVTAVLTAGDGRRNVEIRARAVVLAAGALETPALLLRSRIGGPAAGQHLRVHPVIALAGLYPEAIRSWEGAPQTTVVDQFIEQDFIVECPGFSLALSAASIPWRSGAAHKAVLAELPRLASFIAIVRDRGAGRVTIDGRGRSRVHYPLGDERDRQSLRSAAGALARLHAAAGADEVFDLARDRPTWRRGEDVEAFAARLRRVSFRSGARPIFSAHQMGSARMGRNPRSSVANERGELHDVRGIWIADTSAFPSAIGANPMITCMALARRTARALLDSDGVPTRSTARAREVS